MLICPAIKRKLTFDPISLSLITWTACNQKFNGGGWNEEVYKCLQFIPNQINNHKDTWMAPVIPVLHEPYLSLFPLLISHCLTSHWRLAWTSAGAERAAVNTQHGRMSFGAENITNKTSMISPLDSHNILLSTLSHETNTKTLLISMKNVQYSHTRVGKDWVCCRAVWKRSCHVDCIR